MASLIMRRWPTPRMHLSTWLFVSTLSLATLPGTAVGYGPTNLDNTIYDDATYTRWAFYPETTDCTGTTQGTEVYLPFDSCYATSTSTSEKYSSATSTQVTINHYDSDATCSGSSTAVTYTVDTCGSHNSRSRILQVTPSFLLDPSDESDTWHETKTSNYVNYLWWWATASECSVATVRPYMINSRDGVCYFLTSNVYYRTFESENAHSTTNPSEKLLAYYSSSSDCSSGSSRLELSMATNACETSSYGDWYNHFYYNNFSWTEFWYVMAIMWTIMFFPPFANLSWCMYVLFAGLDDWNGGFVHLFISGWFSLFYSPFGIYTCWGMVWWSIAAGKDMLTGHIFGTIVGWFLPGNFIIAWVPTIFLFEYLFGKAGVCLLFGIVFAMSPLIFNWVVGYPISALCWCLFVKFKDLNDWNGGIYSFICGMFALAYPVVGPYLSWALVWAALVDAGMGFGAHAIAMIWALAMPMGLWLAIIPVAVAAGSIHPAATFIILALAFGCCVYPTDPFSQVTLRYIFGFPLSIVMWWVFISDDDIDDLNGGANWFVVAAHGIFVPVVGPWLFHSSLYFGLRFIQKEIAAGQFALGLLSLPFGLWSMWIPILVLVGENSPAWVALLMWALWVVFALPGGIYWASIPLFVMLMVLEAPSWMLVLFIALYAFFIWPFYGNIPCLLLTNIGLAMLIPGPWYWDWFVSK